jgi:hypothetical protein
MEEIRKFIEKTELCLNNQAFNNWLIKGASKMINQYLKLMLENCWDVKDRDLSRKSCNKICRVCFHY